LIEEKMTYDSIIHIPPNFPTESLKEILEELPEFSVIEIHYDETGLAMRGMKQNNKVMILQMKDPKDNYKRNDGFRRSTINICLDLSKL
jgi:hypothetical protein